MQITDSFFLLYFFPIFIVVYLFIKRKIIFANLLIVLVSLYFYSTFGLSQLPILILPLIMDYFLAIIIFKERKPRLKKTLLLIGIAVNVMLLFYFKYVVLFKDLVAIDALIVPLGISFITFQRISYIVDVYKKMIRPEKNFLTYSTYATLFPHLVSGPIVRYSQIKKSLNKRIISATTIFVASKYLVFGLAFKILVANQLYTVESHITNIIKNAGTFEAIILLIYFSFRIYFDFLGYSLMAMGLAKFMGFDFPINFNSPYQAKSITDFWRRWNITLSLWIRDYLYIPLGGNRRGINRTYFNLLIVMLLAGLWHGASWNFVLWGGLHGALLIIERYLKIRIKPLNLSGAIKILYTFATVSLLWVVFKFTNIDQLMQFMSALLNLKLTIPNSQLISIILFSFPALIFAIYWSFTKQEINIVKIKPGFKTSLFLIIMFVVSLTFLYSTKSTFFIYYQF